MLLTCLQNFRRLFYSLVLIGTNFYVHLYGLVCIYLFILNNLIYLMMKVYFLVIKLDYENN